MMETRRAVKRQHMTDSVRIELAEDDLDTMERAIDALRTSLNRLTVAVLGASLSLVVASLLLAVDIARGR